jgi:SOS-response transcriptional repressor LexA
MSELTPRQAEIYEYLLSFVEQHGRQPVLREIGSHFGIKTPTGVWWHLKKLERQGFIRVREGFSGVEFVGVKFKRDVEQSRPASVESEKARNDLQRLQGAQPH